MMRDLNVPIMSVQTEHFVITAQHYVDETGEVPTLAELKQYAADIERCFYGPPPTPEETEELKKGLRMILENLGYTPEEIERAVARAHGGSDD